MFCSDPRGSLLDGHGAGEALDNGDFWKEYWDQPEGGTSQFATSPNHAKVNPGSMNVQPPQWAQQPGGTSQFATTPHHAEVNSRSMNVQRPQWAQQPGGTSQFATSPNHAKVNPGSMNVQPPQWAQQPDTLGEGTSKFATTPHHAKVNSRSMNVRPPQWAQQSGAINNVNPSISTQMNSFPLAEPGTSVSSNITNADAAKRARKKECDRKFRERKEKERRENAEKVVEFADEINDLRKDNERLEKERVEAKIKQMNSDQIISDLKEEVSRLTNEKKIQTMQVAVLSEIVVSSPEATDVAEENKLFKRKIELLMTSTNNPDIIKTVELQEENEKLKRENKKLRILNDALCDKLSKDDQ